MKSVGLKILKNKLSEYVRMAAAGETVLITDRDRVVAELVPPQLEHPKRRLEPWEEKGVREGWLRPAQVVSREPLPHKPVMSFEELMDDIARDREDRT